MQAKLFEAKNLVAHDKQKLELVHFSQSSIEPAILKHYIFISFRHSFYLFFYLFDLIIFFNKKHLNKVHYRLLGIEQLSTQAVES